MRLFKIFHFFADISWERIEGFFDKPDLEDQEKSGNQEFDLERPDSFDLYGERVLQDEPRAASEKDTDETNDFSI